MKFTLRDYQLEAFDALRDGLRRGIRAQVLCMPTGSGKTVCASALIEAALQKGTQVDFVADRKDLVLQTGRRLLEAGIPHGITMAKHMRGQYEPVQVCSAQTLEARGWQRNTGLLIVDECHAIRKSTIEYIQRTGIPTIGLSATPFTKGLGKVFDRVVNACTTDDLLEKEWLAPLKVYSADAQIDMTGAATSAGEWTAAAAAERAIPIVGDIVAEWQQRVFEHFGGPVTTIVFSANIEHGKELLRQFGEAGYRFEQITGYDTDDTERQAKIHRLEQGVTVGLISVDALSRGFDVPQIRCVVSARPYRTSLAAHIQQIGRGMRIAPGKEYAILNDHAGNYLRLAEQTERFWSEGCNELDDGRKKPKEQRAADEDRPPRVCPSCKLVVPSGALQCPMCGHQMPRRRNPVRTVAGSLAPYLAAQGARGTPRDPWRSLCRLAVQRRTRKPLEWARANYKELMGQWPPKDWAFDPAPRADKHVQHLVQEAYARWRKARTA